MNSYKGELEDFLSYGSDVASHFLEEYDLEGYDFMTDGGGETYDHLDDVPDGAGCTEIWEKLSEDREGVEESLEER